jgi:hypothetical protein
MKRILFILFLFTTIAIYGQCPANDDWDYVTINGAGQWTDNADWTPDLPASWYNAGTDTWTIPSGVIVEVRSSNFEMLSKLVVEGALVVTGKLNMATGTSIDVKTGGVVCCNDGGGSCNLSDRISIGGTQIWDGTDGTVTGPAYSDGTYPLPIVLLYFRVSLNKEEKNVQVEWATEDEENFSHFVIERAGRDLKFSPLAEVPGAGYNTNSIKKYSTTDENPLVGIGYYRLKAIDIDGSYEYFSVKSVEYNGNKRMLVSPNPASGNGFTYTINFDPGPFDRVTLINQVGTELYSAPVTGTENEFVPESSLRPGAYLLRYTSPDFTEVARVFIKK